MRLRGHAAARRIAKLMTARQPQLRYATFISLIVLSGCSWVDATGRQANDGANSSDPSGLPVVFSTAVPLALTEQQPQLIRLDGSDSQLSGWRWRTLDAPGDPLICASVSGFDTDLAVRTLPAACSDSDNCTLAIDESRDEQGARFAVSLPALRAPVAARVVLSTTDNDGRLVEREHTLCGVSVNEAPDARNDHYTIDAGLTLRVEAGTDNSLIANDRDDIDVRNSPLSVDTRPARAPRFAELFELGSDGSFIYRADTRFLDQTDGMLQDSFAYTLRDGLFEVEADVTIEILAANAAIENQPPIAREALPDVEYVVDPLFGVDVRLNLASRFEDPDGDELSFTVRPGSLPPGGTLALSRNGILFGRLSAADFGRWRVSVIADDGQDTLEQDFLLTVLRPFEANQAPIASDISNRIVSDNFTYDIAPFFDDPDGDRLSFTANGLPDRVSISSNGVISGRSSKRNRRAWFVVVTASDGRGGSASDGFRLTIQ